MARLAAAVHVEHPETHEWLILQPGEDVDPVLAAAITNPHTWEETPEPPADDDPETDPPSDPEATTETEPTPAPKPAAVPEPEPEQVPAEETEPTPVLAAEPQADPKPARTRTRKTADK
ncbi:hypothetical protein [Streptomyces sp. NPDC005968]|uniref:hypothetical protein n=1 Tax=unclassified Streptomyces TaxID=2593676 RepID=UPI0033E4ED7F